MRPLRLAIVAVFVSSISAVAAAQETAAAGALFDRGLTEMQAGRYQTGCPALAESYRLDPRPGTLFTVAECNAKWGKIATAVGYYEDYLGRFARMPADQQAAQRGRDKIAVQQRDTLRPSIPQLTLELGPTIPPGSIVTRDGVELGAPSLGIALPIDPGEHRIVVKAPDGKTREQRIQIASGEKKTLRVELERAIEPASVTPPPVHADAAATDGASSPLRTWAFVAGGVGAVGLVVGVTTGGLALGKKSTIDTHCTGFACDAEGKRAADRAQTLAAISTIGFGVGIVGIAAGVILLVAAPPAKSTTAAVGPFAEPRAGGGVSGLEGVW